MDQSVAFVRRHRSALTIAAIGVTVSVAVAVAVSEGLERRAIERLDRDAGHISRDVTAAHEAAGGRVQGLRALFDASETVTELEFSRFTTRVGGSPGLVGLGVAVWVPHGELEDFERRAIADRSWFRIARHPDASPDHDHLIVWYANQFRVIPRGIGLDLSSDPVRAEAIRRLPAETAGTVSGFVDVPGTGDATVEIYAPIDLSGGGRGVAFGTLDLSSVVAAEMETMRGAIETARLVDVPGAGEPVRAPERWEGDIDLGSRVLRLQVTSTEESIARTWVPLAIIAGGLLATILAALIDFLRSGARERDIEIRHLLRTAEEKDVFLASVSHELRTPLTSVLGLTGIVVHDWEQLSPADVRDYVAMAHNEANELTDLVEDLLTMGRVEAGAITFARETVDLRAEVAHVVARVITDKQVTIDLDEGAALVAADPLRVRQIVRNLVVNAVRYGQSRIDIASIGDGKIGLVVRNDGPPIDPEQLPHLFSPYQGRRRRRGQPESIGLGLHISRRLARGMGGDLSYDYVGGWCVFRLALPGADPSGSAIEPEDVTASTR